MNKSKTLGTYWETQGVNYLLEHGISGAERRALRGNLDCGDLIWPHPTLTIVCESKNEKSISLAQYMKEVEIETANAGADVGWAWVKARGKSVDKSYIVMHPGTVLSLLERIR